MKQLMKLRSVWPILFVSLLSSCAQIKIKNTEWCGDLGPTGAACFNTLNDNQRQLSPAQWEKERFGMLCTKAENFSDWKATILKLCKANPGRCSIESQNKIVKFIDHVDGYIEKTYIVLDQE